MCYCNNTHAQTSTFLHNASLLGEYLYKTYVFFLRKALDVYISHLSLSLSLCRNSPTRASVASFLMFLDQIRHTTIGTTSVDRPIAETST
jgi:hypothetical protein